MGIRLYSRTLSVLLICSLIAGCAGSPAPSTEKQQLKIKLLHSDADSFYRLYGNLYEMKNDKVEFEIVSTREVNQLAGSDGMTYEEAYDEVVERERPDILILDTSEFHRYIADGKLAELDPFIARDKYDIDTFLPGLVDELRQFGGDKLYGLAFQFYGTAVYYNQDLFIKHGVEPPYDGITWEEIIHLAQRFPVDGDEESRIYGLASQYPPNFKYQVMIYSAAAGLSIVDPSTMQVTVHTESWKKVYELALETVQSGTIHSLEEAEQDVRMSYTKRDYYTSHPFMMGRAAMIVETGAFIPELVEARADLKDFTPFELGLAAGPADPADPGTTRENTLGEIFAINANAKNKDAAWEFVKFVNSTEFARVRYSNPRSLKTRMETNRQYHGIDLSAFYTLRMKLDPNGGFALSQIPKGFFAEFQSIQDREIKFILDGQKSIDEALEEMQTEGQQALNLARHQ